MTPALSMIRCAMLVLMPLLVIFEYPQELLPMEETLQKLDLEAQREYVARDVLAEDTALPVVLLVTLL